MYTEGKLWEIEFRLIAAQNIAIRTNYIQATINDVQQNSKCRLYGDKDKTMNHIISEWSKLAKNEYKSKNDWLGKITNSEFCKKLKFDHTTKWYMHK